MSILQTFILKHFVSNGANGVGIYSRVGIFIDENMTTKFSE